MARMIVTKRVFEDPESGKPWGASVAQIPGGEILSVVRIYFSRVE